MEAREIATAATAASYSVFHDILHSGLDRATARGIIEHQARMASARMTLRKGGQIRLRVPLTNVATMRFAGMTEEQIRNEIWGRGAPHPEDLAGWKPEDVAEYLAAYAGVPYVTPRPAGPPLEDTIREFWDKALREAPNAPEVEAAFRDALDVPSPSPEEVPEPARPTFRTSVIPAPVPAHAVPVITPTPVTKASERLGILELVERVIESDRRRNRVNEGTSRGFRTSVALFCEVMRIRYADEITQKIIEDFCASLDRLPPDYRRGSVGRATPIWDIIAKAEKDGVRVGLSAKTVNKQLEAVQKIIRHARANGVNLPQIEVSILRVRDDEAASEKREPFTRDDVRAIFKQPPLALSAERGPLFWNAHVAAYTGARREEIAGLDRDDIEERDGVPVFVIRSNEHRKLKNGQSARIIPIHDDLIALGLLEYAKSRPPGLLWDVKKKGRTYGNDFEYGWQKVKRAAIGTEKKTFHSFRHSAIQTLLDEGVPLAVRAALFGHDPGHIEGKIYGGEMKVSTLLDAIKKLPSVR